MSDYAETGIQMNANLTSELLINTFIPNSPLHDGAVIIKKRTRYWQLHAICPCPRIHLFQKNLGQGIELLSASVK